MWMISFPELVTAEGDVEEKCLSALYQAITLPIDLRCNSKMGKGGREI